MSARTLRKKLQPIVLPDLSESLDHGSEHLIARGEIIREDRPEPANANRTISGSRRMDGLRLMWSAGLVSKAQWQGAEDFRRDLELSTGASDKNTTGIRSASIPEPGQVQLDAIARMRGATKAVGQILSPILNWIVVEGKALRPFYVACRMRHQTAEKMAVEMLDKLADYYSGPYKK